MATSGSTDFALNRDEIVNMAYGLCGAVAVGEIVSAEESVAGVRALNAMVKAWQAESIQLWKIEELQLFLTTGTEKYSLGASADKAALDADTIVTRLNGAHDAAATAITVDATTGMAAADIIGFELTDGTLHWDTIASIGSSTALAITTGLLTAASDNGVVYTYTTAITTRPLQVIAARLRNWNDPTAPIDTPFADLLSRDQYMSLPQKKSSGPPVQGYYDPQLATTSFHMFPAPEAVDHTIMMTVKMPLDDFDAAANTPDFPPEWIEALGYGLAVRLAPRVGTPLNDRLMLKAEADEKKYSVGLFDSEPSSLFFQPDIIHDDGGQY